MGKNATHQEILLVTNTSFAQRQWSEKDQAGNAQYSCHSEELERACWNGLVWELFPEIMATAATGRKLYLWSIRQKKCMLKFELSETTPEMEKAFSIDSDLFASTVIRN